MKCSFLLIYFQCVKNDTHMSAVLLYPVTFLIFFSDSSEFDEYETTSMEDKFNFASF